MKTAAKDFKMTELGPIPKDWDVKRLGDCCSITTGHKDVNEGCENGHFPFFTCSRDVYRANCYSFDGEAILVAGNGDVGNLHYCNGKFEAYQRTYVLMNFKIDTQYLWCELGANLMERLTDGKIGTSIPYIVLGQLQDYMFALPPLPEQRKIAAALSDVDEMIAALEKLIEKKRKIKTGAMQRLLTGPSSPDGFAVTGKTRLPGFKGAWVEKRLGEIGSWGKGAGISRSEAQTGRLPAVRYGEIYTTHNDYIKKFESFISDEVARQSTRMKKGDIVFAGSGETKEEIGKCAAFLGDEEAYAGGDLIILSPESQYDSKFLGFVLNSSAVVAQKSAAGQGDAVVHIRMESLAAVVVRIPHTLAEQKAIAKVLGDMDEEIAALEAELDKTRQLKQGMMQELLTGKVRLV